MKTLKSLASPKTSYIIFFVFFLIPLAGNIVRAWHGYFSTDALGIYQQGIFEIAFSNSWNPYTPIINMPILNDHFDPAIYLAAAFVRLTTADVVTVLVFEWLWWIGCIVFIWLTSTELKQRLVGLALVIFCRGLLQGLDMPIHPTTWSMLPGMLFIYFLHKEKFLFALLMGLFMATFREMYYFMFFGVAFYYLLKRNYWQSLLYTLVTALLVWVLFVWRPTHLGQTVQYTSDGIALLKNLDIVGLIKHTLAFDYPFKALMPLIVGVAWLIYKQGLSVLRGSLGLGLLFLLPGIGIHVISGRFTAHHTVPFAAVMIATLHLNGFYKLINRNLVTYAFFIFLLGSVSSRYTKYVRWLVFTDRAAKMDASEKRASFQKLKALISEANPESIFLVSGGLIPMIMEPGLKIVHYSHRVPHFQAVDYLILEKPGTGEPWPMTNNMYREMVQACDAIGANKIIDDQAVTVYQGKLGQDCTLQSKFFAHE